MSVYKNVKLWMQTENCTEKYKLIVENEHYFFYNLTAIRTKLQSSSLITVMLDTLLFN